MPSEPMKQRFIRVGDDLWEAAHCVAARNKTDLSKVIRKLLEQYVSDHPIDAAEKRAG